MRRYAILGLAALAAAAPARAQGTGRDSAAVAIADAGLPPETARRLTAFFNDPEVIHFTGRTRIPPDRSIGGDVAVLGGPVTVGGTIDGGLLVIDGDVKLLEGARVTGGLTVVGGVVSGLEHARVGGEVVAYSDRLAFRREGERIVYTGPTEGAGFQVGHVRQGRADFVVATGQSYNRVEGLPITFGPVIETVGANPLRLRASAIYRTEEGTALGPDRWGYDVRLEQFVGGHGAVRVGASLRRVVDPIEAWHLSKLENGLSTFFLHRDYRDHYERRGWSGYVMVAPEGSPFSATAEYRDERDRSLPSGSPWTIFKNDEAWRAQPLVGEGVLRTVAVSGAYDTRNHRGDPSTGWFVSTEVERSLGTDLRRPEADVYGPLGAPGAVLPAVDYGGFTQGTVDVRRYNRISPTSRLNLRLLAGGALDGGALPPQRQHALGGEGSLPGYTLFSLDCGARSQRYVRARDVGRGGDEPPPAFYAGYGCDRFALAQAEYRGSLRFRLHWDADDEGDVASDGAEGWHGRRRASWNADFAWVVFMDAGRGWAAAAGMDEPTAVDVGLGVVLGRLGIYGAVPLDGGGGVNVFVRLNPRF
ncbi:MAG: hypothetical protein JWM27_3754 [Gemmatimonadetes bacterium]|nr:hypothetical protein [Gemmatimonadota bacterium]